MVDERKLYTTHEACIVLGVPYTSFLRAIHKLGIVRMRVGQAHVLDVESVRQLADHFGVEPPCLSCAS